MNILALFSGTLKLFFQFLCVLGGNIESLRLEKTSKIIKSNRQPNTTVSAKP